MKQNEETIKRLVQYSTTYANALKAYLNSPDQPETVAVMMNAISRIYNVLSPVTVDLSDSTNGWESTQQMDSASACDVSVKIINDMLVVRVPNLASKFSSFSRAHAADYSTMFAAEVRQLMMTLDLSGLDLTHKHISIIGVYVTKAQKIPDADNLDAKAIVDAITRYLPGGDDWAHCTFSNANIRSETIKPGTYFMVSPHYREPPSLRELTHRLEAEVRKQNFQEQLRQIFNIPRSSFEPD